MQKLNKIQKELINKLLNSYLVDEWDKQLLKGIKGNNFKNVSPSDNTLLIKIFDRYQEVNE